VSIVVQTLAQIASDNTSVLLTYGPLGVICAWFMLRAEKVFTELRSLSHRIDGLTRALLADMVERDSVGIQTKKYARAEIAKIEARLPKI
jgi:hypothetical protein